MVRLAGNADLLFFLGQAGHLSVLKEARPRGAGYWYAYHWHQGKARKRYLGRTTTLTLARLEAVARDLGTELASQPADRASRHITGIEHERSGVHKASTGLSLEILLSSLVPPPVPNALVEREPLMSRLDGALAHALTLVSAGAGWGKTTLLSVWASRYQEQIAWLSLLELDNSPTRFWVGLITALRRGTHTPALGQTAVALLQSPQPPPFAAILTTLLNELASREAHPAPLVLILDDYQVICDSVIHEGMSFFLEHLPAYLHVILSSRVDPDLPLARWRARWQLVEIREADLCFSFQEASHYLGQMLSPTLSEEEVRQLVSRTEGWIAGLQLASLTLQKRADRAAFLQTFSGSQRSLVDYVQQDILACVLISVRNFLLHSSILSRLDASVCQAVTSAPTKVTSQQMLMFLERANLFLVPLDEEQRSYRLHDLFREALLAILHASQPEMVPLLHRRAARFYEAEGQWTEAITHAFQAADFSTVARLMEQTVEQFWIRGEAATMVRWVMTLPEALVREHARLLLTTALYLLNTVTHTTQEQRTRVHAEMRQLMARVEMALRREGNGTDQEISATGTSAVSRVIDLEARAAEDALLQRRLRLLRAGMALYEAIAVWDLERLSALHQEMQELVPDEEVIWQMLPLFCSYLLYHTAWGQGARLLPTLLEVKQQVSRSGSHFAITRVMPLLATAAVEAGQLRLAYEESLAVLDLIEQIVGYALLKGYFELILAQVLYQWNRLEEARDRLQKVIQDAATWQHNDLLLSGYTQLMQVALVTGNSLLALQALQDLEQLVQRERYGIYPNWLPAMRARWWLAQGHLEAASDWAARVLFPQGAWESSLYYAFPVVIRVFFAQRSFQQALDLLERWSAHLDRPTNVRITITYLAQLLVALHQTGKRDQARVVAARLLALTKPEGYLRVYLDEGDPMKQALQGLLSSTVNQQESNGALSHAYVSRLLAAFEQEEYQHTVQAEDGLASAYKTAPLLRGETTAREEVAASVLFPLKPLTAQEQRVLRLLVAGRSTQEIAASLVVSVNTVKTHLKHLYSKLQVRSRTQATEVARQRQLL